MSNIAVDVGFGSTKYVTDKVISKFPSAITKAQGAQADFELTNHYDYNGQSWLVGDDAVKDALTTRSYEFLEYNAPLLLFKALQEARIDLSNPINLATGLSLLHWSKREQFGNMLSDFVVNKTRVQTNVQLIPQGKGIYLDYISQHPNMSNKLVMIVDIGYCSLDVIPFQNGKPLVSDAWADAKGINIIVKELRKKLSKEHHYLNLNEARINEIMINKYLSVEGEKVDISFIVDREKESYNQIIINELQSRNSDIFKSADAIVISGGGAYHFGENRTKNMVFSPTPYEYANARGYLQQLVG